MAQSANGCLPPELTSLIISHPPPFVYVNDPITPGINAQLLMRFLAASDLACAHIDAVACFSPRIIFDTVLNCFRQRIAREGAEERVHMKYNHSMDSFLEGIFAVHSRLKQRLFLLVENPERFRQDSIVPLTRITELSRAAVTVIFVSQVRWEDIRPPLGASPDPYFVEIPVPAKEDIAQYLSSQYPANDAEMNVYHPALHTLYDQFVSLLCDVCYPFTSDPLEIQYIAAARWPGFIQPMATGEEKLTEESRMRLLRGVKPSLSQALEELYPRHNNALDWALKSASTEDVDMESDAPNLFSLSSLPRTSKFLLVAAFIASSNPAKSDIRMFGRGLDEKKRRRRVPRKQATVTSTSKKAQISQHFLGPSPFPLDRLLAIFSALLEENDPPGGDGVTDLEASRAAVYGAITELSQMRLLVRTSAPEKIDGPPTYKCGVSHEMVLGLARELKVPLNDLLWDPV